MVLIIMGVNYICNSGISGYAKAAENNINALLRIPTQVKKIDICGDIEPYLDNKCGFLFYHCIPTFQPVIKNKITIGNATFESTRLPNEWREPLNRNDYIYVPSQFNKQMLLDAGFSNVIYFPHGLNFDAIKLKEKPKNEVFKFLTIGTWHERKNHKEVIKAFLNSFKEDEASLTIKTSRIHENILKLKVAQIAKTLNKPFSHVKINTGRVEDIYDYIQDYDCYISASLGEGFGYTGMEAMAVNVPTILTNYSGLTEYVTEDNCFTLHPEKFLEIDIDGYAQFRRQIWPVISSEQISMRMMMAMNKKVRDEKSSLAYKDVRSKFSYNSVVSEMSGILSRPEN